MILLSKILPVVPPARILTTGSIFNTAVEAAAVSALLKQRQVLPTAAALSETQVALRELYGRLYYRFKPW